MLFQGSGVALITPFNDDYTVDYDKYRELVKFQIENETDAIIACGTTSEATTLTNEEKLNLINITIEECKGKIPVIVGTGSNNTMLAAEYSREISKIDGVDGLLVVTPYYNKATSEGLYQHFKTIAQYSSKPIILYNVPSRTNVNISPETVKRLSEIENIVGIKDATADLHYTAKLKSLLDDDFAIYSGNDDVVVPLLSLGGNGVISVLANLMPKQSHDMVKLFLEGRVKEASQLQIDLLSIIESLFNEVNPVCVKAAMKLKNLCNDQLRLPLTRASEETISILKKNLLELEKIGEQ